MHNFLDYFWHFAILALISFFGAMLTSLIGNEAGVTPIGSTIFAGIWCGACTSIAYHFGNEEWSSAKYLIAAEYAGVAVGTALGALVFLCPGT